jgi:hypothetical protein
MVEVAEARRALEEIADQHARVCIAPIDLSTICATLHVRIRRDRVPEGKALLTQGATGLEIVLPIRSDSGAPSVMERFQVAHELGHVFLLREFKARPLGRGEYWQHESICDAFARRLLISEDLVESVIGRSKASAIRRLRDASSIAGRAQVPWPAAATRLAERDLQIAFLRVRAGGETDAWRVRFSSLPNHKGQNLVIRRGSALASTLGQLRVGNIRSEIPVAALVESGPFAKAVSAAATRPSTGDIRIAIRL